MEKGGKKGGDKLSITHGCSMKVLHYIASKHTKTIRTEIFDSDVNSWLGRKYPENQIGQKKVSSEDLGIYIY